MSIKRYTAIYDNTITNAYQADLTTRGTGSNMGLADSLEVFSIYAHFVLLPWSFLASLKFFNKLICPASEFYCFPLTQFQLAR